MKTFEDLREEFFDEDPIDATSIALITNLVAARNRLKLSQEQVARMTGIPQPSIARIESLKVNPSLGTLVLMGNALGMKLKFVINE